MAKEIKNRRENLLINEVPPEILTADQAADAALEAVADAGYLTDETAATAGFVKNTDYASTTAAGVIKVQTAGGSAVSGSGTLISVARTLEQYNSGAANMFVSKGTLEAVIQSLVHRELIALLGGLDTDASGTTLTAWIATKIDDGWALNATKTTPTP